METRTYSLGFLITDVSRLLRREFERRLESSSLTLAEARALIHVSRNEGVRQIDLAETLEIKPITLTRLVDQLVAEGLVERRADPQDRRAYRIYLTPAATSQLSRIESVITGIRADALQGLSSEEATALQLGLEKMRTNLLIV